MRSRLVKSLMSHWTMYVMLSVPLTYVVIFHYIPMAGLQIAFKKLDLMAGFYAGEWVGFDNFRMFFSSYVFWRLIRNTLAISFYYLILAFPAPILLALALNEVRTIFFKKTIQMVTYAPYFISTVVLVSIIMQILSPYGGMVNNLIRVLGGQPINFMGRPEFFRSIYVVSGVWQGAGYVSIVFIAALTAVDPTLHEAARIDGATKLQKIRHIDLPALLPTTITMMILNMGTVMNVGFEKVYLMQNDMNITTSDVISTYVYQSGLVSGEYGYATAVGMFNSVINLLLVVLFNTLARKYSDTSIW